MLRIYPGGSCPISGSTLHNRKSDLTSPVSSEQRYDQIQFSSQLDESVRRVKETVGKLSQEIRTQVTTQDVERLRQQVANGEYQPSSREIATRMLLMREDG